MDTLSLGVEAETAATWRSVDTFSTDVTPLDTQRKLERRRGEFVDAVGNWPLAGPSRSFYEVGSVLQFQNLIGATVVARQPTKAPE